MDASGSRQSNKSYYDSFAKGYERLRGENLPGGYHEMLDQLEADFVARYAVGSDVLEVGCGTGLVLERIARFARSARGVDLSSEMLGKAKERGLDVLEASATALPFDDRTFDVCCAFKVLAHIPDIGTALSEMARVTRPGGYVLAEFYNPLSFRGFLKRFGPKLSVSSIADEGQVYTRFDTPEQVAALAPTDCQLVDSRGVRIATPFGALLQVPGVGGLLRSAETALCDTPLKRFGGFYIAAFRKRSSSVYPAPPSSNPSGK